MRIINRDLTKETITVYKTHNQIYVKIWAKNSHGKWETSEYFQSYDWEPDESLVNSTVRYIKRTWRLSNPVVIIE